MPVAAGRPMDQSAAPVYVLGTFVLGFLLTMVSVDVAKSMCGRPRPTLIEVCQPDWSRCDADARRQLLSTTDVCQQTDHRLLLRAL